MATGVTKNMWQETVQIISSEHFPYETDYEITYKGKTPEREIISTPYTEKYELLMASSKRINYSMAIT